MTNPVKPLASVTSFLLLTMALLVPGPSPMADHHGESASQALPTVRVVTSEGAFQLQLRPDVAPETVENFLEYVRNGFYEGTLFHRVIPGFMIQGGGFTEAMARKNTRAPITNEATQSLPNLRGTIAMARTSAPDSATSQFFINVANNDFLNAGVRGAGYAVFGKVTQGMGVIDAIAGQETAYAQGMADVPVEPILIETISLIETAQ